MFQLWRRLSFCAALISCACCWAGETAGAVAAPYPASAVIDKIEWQWDTLVTAAPGSDLWPVTWGPDDHLYAAWGDGGGFGGTDSDGRVAMGIARIEGGPEKFSGFNVNGGKNPEHPATFQLKGKTNGIIFVDGVLYAKVNLQDGAWPEVNHALMWSNDSGATWKKTDWFFPKGARNFRPEKFLNFGKDYSGVPAAFAGFVYIYGARIDAKREGETGIMLARVPKGKLRQRDAYDFFQRLDAAGNPEWTADFARAGAVFTDTRGTRCSGVVYNPGLNRFLMTAFHLSPGQLGVFDAPAPWGPWTTVMDAENWGEMGRGGEGLSCEFPQKWMSADGLTLWSVFSVYGEGAKKGIAVHDRLNLVKATLTLKK